MGFAGLGRAVWASLDSPFCSEGPCVPSSGEENSLARFNFQFPLNSALELCVLFGANPVSFRGAALGSR